MSDLVVALRITGDPSGAVGAAREVKAEIAGVGQAAQQAGASASGAFDGVAEELSTVGAAAAENATEVATLGATYDSTAVSMGAFMSVSRELEQALASKATTIAEVDSKIDLLNAAYARGVIDQEAYTAASSTLNKQVAQMESQAGSLAAKYSQSSSAVQQLEADETKLNQAFKDGLIGPQQLSAALAGIGAQRSKLTDITNEAGKVAAGIDKISFSSGGAAREMGVLVGEAARGNFTRMEGSVITLANRTGILATVFSGVGAAVVGVLAVVGSAAALFVASESEINGFNSAIIATGGYAGTTAGQMAELTTQIGEATGHFGEAQTAVTKLAASGRETNETLAAAAQGAVEFAEITDTSIDKAVEVFEKLAEQPGKYAQELNEQFHFLTPEIQQHIDLLEQEGDKADAAAVATNAFSSALFDRYAQYKQQQGGISAAWDGIKNSIGGAVDEAKEFFRTAPSTISSIFSFASNPALGIAQAQANAFNQAAGVSPDQTAASTAQAAAAQKQLTDLETQAAAAADKENQKLTELNATFDKGKVGQVEYLKEKYDALAASKLSGQALDDEKAKIDAEFASALSSAKAADAAVASKKSAAEAARLWAEDENTLHQVLDQANKGVEQAVTLADELIQAQNQGTDASTKYDAQISKLGAGLDDLNTQLNLGTISQQKYDEERQKIIQGSTAAAAAFDRESAAAKERLDVGDQLIQKLQDEITAQSAGTEAQKAWQETEKVSEQALHNLTDLYGTAEPSIQAATDAIARQKDGFEAHVQALLNDSNELKKNQEVMGQWAQIAGSEADAVFQDINKDIIEGGSVMKDLENVAEQTVEAVLAQFERLAIINPLLNSIFGASAGNGGLLPTLENSALGSLFGGSGGVSAATAAVEAVDTSDDMFGLSSIAAAGGSGGGGVLGSGSSGILSTLSNANQSGGILGWLFGSGNIASAGAIPGGGSYTLVDAGSGGFSSLIGSNIGPLSIAGGVLAGLQEFKAAGGGAAGVVGGAAYGVGTIAAGSALTAGVGALAAGAGASGALAAGLAAIGPIGWVGLIAMGVNMLSGGKLFGTSGTPIGGSQTETIGAGGASVDTEETFKGQHALFGGSFYKDHQEATDPAAVQAADDFYTALVNERSDFAKEFNEAAGAVVGGSFQTTFDKKGNVTGTSDTIGGVTYKGETQQQFGEREQSAQLIDLLNGLGVSASAFVAGVQDDADKLIAATKDIASVAEAAQSDVAKGMGLLGASDTSIGDIVNTVISLQGADETLAQTYARLQTEQYDFRQDLDETGLSVGKVGADFVTFADQAAQAAGGIDNLNALFQSYSKNYLTPGQQQTNALNVLQSKSTSDLTALGEDPTEDLAKFNADFLAIKDSLSPAELVQWLTAANDLATFINTEQSALQQYGDFGEQLYGDSFVTAVSGAIEWENKQIDTANQLAAAAGKAGASQQDLAEIMTQGSAQVGKAIADLTVGIANDVQALYPRAAGGDDADGMFMIYNGAQAGAAAQQAKQAQDDSTAYDLIQKLGDYAFISGKSIADTLKQEGVTPEELAATLGETPDTVNKQIAAAETQASSLTHMAATGDIQSGLLQDILDVLQGKAPSFDVAQLGTPDPGTATGGKIGSGNTVPSGSSATSTSADVVAVVKTGNDRIATAHDVTNSLLTDQNALLRQLISGGGGFPGNRNQRPIFGGRELVR